MNKGIVVGILLFVSCASEPNNTEKLNNEIMRIHDEAMAKSAYVLKLKKIVNNKIDSTANISLKDSLQHISSELYKADRFMLDWMHQYQEPNLKSDTAQTYLQSQLEMIQKVHSLTFNSIQHAEFFLHEK